ncbi:MAG: helix-turn-helix domain-containing protein [Thermoplasmatota archaeon]
MAKALDLEFRRELHALIKTYPGLHLRELARQLGTSVALIEYHIPVLVDAGLVDVTAEGYQRVFPKDIGEAKREWLGMLREDIPTRMVLLLLQEGPMRHGALASELDLGKSKASFHLKKLVSAGILEKEGHEFKVSKPKEVTQLLIAYKPTRDLRDSFASLWSNFYGRRS